MYKLGRLTLAIGLVAGRIAGAQSTAAYRAQLDSLVRVWQPLAEAEERAAANRRTDIPPIAFAVGPLNFRSDSAMLDLAHAAAARLAPLIEREYGASASRLAPYTFVVLSTGNAMAAVTDSTGRMVLRGGIFRTIDAVFQAWESRATEMLFDHLDPELRDWVGGSIPLERLRRADFNDTRVRLLLEGSNATRDCVNGKEARCAGALGLTSSGNPLFALYDATERAAIVKSFASILRRTEPVRFDRCASTLQSSVCDSLAELIPPDVVPLAAPPAVRQNFVRFALEEGGTGALDRFIAPGTPRERIERASRMPADTVVAHWQANFSNTRSTSTALDTTTALSSLVWAAACATLALRSSRWR